MINFFTFSASFLALLSCIIMFFVSFNVRKSRTYLIMTALFSGFFLFFFLFTVFRMLDSSVLADLLELIALAVLLVFAVYHLKVEGIENKGEQ
ncbi:hypothetical protein HZB89_00440 [archaeon]|nr:hypothetical protein [archaeon]